MASILMCCTPAYGHVRPMLAVGRDLVEHGHDVRMLTGAAYRPAVQRAGLGFVPLPPEADLDVDHPNAVLPERAAMRPIPQLRFSLLELFIRPIGPQVAAIDRALDERRTDLVLTEMLFLGASVVARRSPGERPPVAAIGIFPLAMADPGLAPYGFGVLPLAGPIGRLRNGVLTAVARRFFAPVLRAAAVEAAAALHGPVGAFDLADLAGSTDLVLQLTVPSFEYPRRGSGAVRFVGPMPDGGDASVLPAWWGDLDGRVVVHVSQGTAANDDPSALILPTLRALADEDVLVVAATGGVPVERLGPLPPNARAAEHLDYAALFPHVDVFVTNGGYGGLHTALRHGVPIVAAGTSEDKLETTARVRWSGAGVRLRTARPRPAAVRRAVRRVLRRPRYRVAARHLQAEIAAAPGLAGIRAAVDELTSGSVS